MSSKIHSLHYLRGLAALLVAFGHSAWFPFDKVPQRLYMGTTLDEMGPSVGNFLHAYTFLPSRTFPVAVFFLLSGYVLEFSLRKNATEFVVNRIFRIYPVFMMSFIFYYAMIKFSGTNISWGNLFGNLFLINSNAVVNVSWTLNIEMRYYLYSAIFAFFGLSGIARAWIFVVLLLWTADSTLFWICYMSIGAIFSDLETKERQAQAQGHDNSVAIGGWLMVLAYTAVFWYVGFARHQIPYKAGTAVGEVSSAIFVFMVAVVKLRHMRDNRILTWLGDISYPLYCIHIPAMVVCWMIFHGRLPGVVIPFLGSALALTAADVLHRTVEEPFIAHGRRLTGLLKERGWYVDLPRLLALVGLRR